MTLVALFGAVLTLPWSRANSSLTSGLVCRGDQQVRSVTSARREEPKYRHTNEGKHSGNDSDSAEGPLAAVLQEPLCPTRRQPKRIDTKTRRRFFMLPPPPPRQPSRKR